MINFKQLITIIVFLTGLNLACSNSKSGDSAKEQRPDGNSSALQTRTVSKKAQEIVGTDGYTAYNVGPGAYTGCLAFGKEDIRANPDFSPTKYPTNHYGKCQSSHVAMKDDGSFDVYEIVAYCDVKPRMRYYFYDIRSGRTKRDSEFKAICDHNRIPGEFFVLSR